MTYRYDANHRLTSYTDPNGATTTLTYDDQGRVARHVDALGNTRTETYGERRNSIHR